MKAVIVFESLWGNTAAIARAIGEGLGPGTPVMSTTEATGQAIAEADLIVAGAPVLAFRLPDDRIRENLRLNPGKAPTPPDLSAPPLRAWLAGLPRLPGGRGRFAAFETRIWWSPGGSTGAISRGLQAAGYARVLPAHKFIVTGAYGPLKAGEIERARHWGAELAQALAHP